jgi:hypothetical protein
MSWCGGCCGGNAHDDDMPTDADTFNEALYQRSGSPYDELDAKGDNTSDFGTNYSCSEYERAVRNPTSASADTILPSWVNDKEALECWGCQGVFQELSFFSLAGAAKNSPQDKTRRHHCRRCRNVFCGACSSNKAVIMLTLEGSPPNSPRPQPVRVCDRCYKEIPDENHFLQVQRNMLLRGELFTKSTMMGMSQSVMRLMLSVDNFSLYLDTGHSLQDFEANSSSSNNLKRKQVALSEIDSCHMKKLTRLEIVLLSGKTYNLDADNNSTVQNWLSALKVASQRAKHGSLKTKIELERRQRKEAERRNEENQRKFEKQVEQRHKTKLERDNIRSKYKR